MNKKSVKLGKGAIINKDLIVKLQEDQLNKLKGGKEKVIDQDTPKSLSCIATSCNYPCE
ncbi:class I lanthipeptide [Chryseobacterium sp. G0186]|uniref:class I lanthipeptide n=1 Tax=Chryseobacterium sp. G0186 TaxID=2487064 RepID=UPI0013DDC5E5|nr:class I lanthipeptide [Chryseobacterium sp. G0186]